MNPGFNSFVVCILYHIYNSGVKQWLTSVKKIHVKNISANIIYYFLVEVKIHISLEGWINVFIYTETACQVAPAGCFNPQSYRQVIAFFCPENIRKIYFWKVKKVPYFFHLLVYYFPYNICRFTGAFMISPHHDFTQQSHSYQLDSYE